MSAADQHAIEECMKVHSRSIHALMSGGVGAVEQMMALAHVLGAMVAGLPLKDARSVRDVVVQVIDLTEHRARTNAERQAGGATP